MCAPGPSSPAQPQLSHECGHQHLHSIAKQCTSQALPGHSFRAHLGQHAVPAGDEDWKTPSLEHVLNCWPCSSSMSLGPRLLQAFPISGRPQTTAPTALELKGPGSYRGPCPLLRWCGSHAPISQPWVHTSCLQGRLAMRWALVAEFHCLSWWSCSQRVIMHGPQWWESMMPIGMGMVVHEGISCLTFARIYTYKTSNRFPSCPRLSFQTTTSVLNLEQISKFMSSALTLDSRQPIAKLWICYICTCCTECAL